jgi:hypothetical protein
MAPGWTHLLANLRRRAPARYRLLRSLDTPEPHPLFRIVPGGIRDWERVRMENRGPTGS